jgi:anti-sigma factor RsiW
MPATKDASAELMTAYLDAELPADEAAAFEARLAEDPETAAEVEQLRRIMSLVQGLPEVQAPPDFAEKVARRVRRRMALGADATWSLVSLPFQVLSIIVILTVAGLYMMAQLEQQPTAIEREHVPSSAPDEAPAPDEEAPAPTEP